MVLCRSTYSVLLCQCIFRMLLLRPHSQLSLSMLCRVCAGLPVRFTQTEVRVPEAEQTVQVVVEAITGDAFIIISADLRLVEDPNESGCLEPGQ